MSKQDERIHLVRVDGKNFRRLEVAEVTLDGAGLVAVTGKNRAGKSTLLSGIAALLGETRDIVADNLIRDGAEEGYVSGTLSNGYALERRFTENGPAKGYLTLTTPDGLKVKTGVGDILKGWAGPLSFDPLAFFHLGAQRQREILLSLGDDPDLGRKIQAKRDEKQRIHDERTKWIAQERRHSGLAAPDGERPEPVDVSATVERVGELREYEAETDALRASLKNSSATVERLEARSKELREELARVEKAAKEATAQVVNIRDEIAAREDHSAEIETMDARLRTANEVADAIKPWEKYDADRAELDEAKAQKRRLTSDINTVESEIDALVASAGIPVDGVSFGEDGEPLLNGRSLNVASGAERARMAIHIAMAADPELGICLLDRGDELDAEELEVIAGLAEEFGFQAWLARIVPTDQGTEVVVVDGVAKS